ncbi:MAG TPA: benzoate-CoA ligase family protein [Myxococcales bacterium]|nr:benzoate-CoA ligase family protein [Myxococcales bacterium]
MGEPYNAAVDLLERNLAHPEKPAFRQNGRVTTYGDLCERANRAGNALAGLGLQIEQRVLLCMLDTPDFAAVFWGALKAGFVPVPVNTLLTTADYDYLLRDSRARVLVVSAPLLAKLEPIVRGQPFLRSVVVAGGPVPAGQASLDDLLAKASPHLDPAPTHRDDVAFWLYSSGSTGQPKGAMHLHGDLAETARLYGKGVLGIRPDDLGYSAAKLFFAYGLGNAMTFPFAMGACSVLLEERPTPQSVVKLLREERPTLFFGVPTLFAAILADPAATDLGGRLRFCVSAGEPLPRDIGMRWRERYGVDILDGIGSTEMLHIFLSLRPGDIRYGTTGKPVPGYDVQIVDEQDRPVDRGEIGELRVRGPSSAIAYWNNREKSVHAFRGPWTYTGDKYQQDPEGYFVYCGRSDDMIKAGGQWVSPAEVEAALVAHPCVLECAVVAHKDENQLDKPKAFVVLKPGVRATADELQRFVKERLAPFKYPRWVEFLDALPKTATGKIQRFKLRQPHS